MILGMSLSTFTYIHVVISLIAIGAGFIVVYGMIAAKRLPLLTNHCVDQPDRFPVPLQGTHPRARAWNPLPRRVGRCGHCPPSQPFRRRMARNLCDQRHPGPLLQFLRADRAVVPEDTRSACARSNPIRTRLLQWKIVFRICATTLWASARRSPFYR